MLGGLVSNNLDQLEATLREFEKSESSNRLTLVEDLVRVRQELERSLQLASSDELTRLSDLQSRYERLANPLGDELVQKCLHTVAIYKAGTQSSDLGQFENDLTQLRQMLIQLVGLVPLYQSAPTVRELQNQLQILSRRFTSTQQFNRLQDEVNDLERRAAKIEQANPDTAIDYLKQARGKLDTGLESEIWETNAREEIIILRDRVSRAYDDVRNRHLVPTTKQSGGELVLLISYFADLVSANPATPVTYFVNERLGAEQETMPVSKALPIARLRLLNTVWRPKLDEYIQAARAELGQAADPARAALHERATEHHPREARALLDQWKSLPGLGDPRIGLEMPRNLKLNIEDVEKVIGEELNALEQVEKLAQEIQWESNASEAFKKWQQIKEAYPYYGGLKALRAQIIEKGRMQIKTCLSEAEGFSRDAQWRPLSTRLEQVEDLFNAESSLRLEFQDQLEHFQVLGQLVKPLTFVGNRRLKRDDEVALLEELEQKYADSYWKDWKDLQKRLAELEAANNVKSLREQVDALCKPDVAVEVLDSVLQIALEMQAAPPPSLLDGDRNMLSLVIDKLDAWLGLARARDELTGSQDNQNMEPDEFNLPNPPNLDIVRDGLAKARKDTRALQATRDLKLGEKLQSLERNDALAHPALAEFRNRLVEPSFNQLRQLGKQVASWTRKASSYRADFLQLDRDIKQALALQMEQEARRLIALAEPNWFIDLDIHLIEDLQRENNELGIKSNFNVIVNGPLEIARAQMLERKSFSTTSVQPLLKQFWERAYAANEYDPLRAQYCRERAKQAFMESEIERARLEPKPENAERILRSLGDDPLLAKEPRVWLEHASLCLRVAKALLRTKSGLTSDGLVDYLDLARRSYNRALAIADTRLLSTDLAQELPQWEKLADTEKKILELLENDTHRVQSILCSDAKTRYDQAATALVEAETKTLLDTFWNGARSRARARAESEPIPPNDVFGRLDAMWSIVILYPEDTLAKKHLEDVIYQAGALIDNKVEDILFDDSATKFMGHYVRGANPQLLKGEEVVHLQIEEAQELQTTVRTLRNILNTLPLQIFSTSDTARMLIKKESDLADWITQLQELRNALGPANTLIEDGLREPAQFDKARWILRKGGINFLEMRRVPDNFMNQGHPSYRAAESKLHAYIQRRRNQEYLALRLLLCLKYETAAHVQDLTQSELNQEENETLVRLSRELGLSGPAEDYLAQSQNLLNELRQKLASPVQPVYPVMVALDTIDELRDPERGDPEDACGLQARLRYHNPDEQERLVITLSNIKQVVEPKVNQVRALRRWLDRFSSHGGAGGVIPGIVDWQQAKMRIFELRDSGPGGLGESKKECRRVCEGDAEGKYNQTWSLMTATRELGIEQRQQALDSDAPGNFPVQLYILARKLDQERVLLQNRIESDIAECRRIEADIDRRLAHFPGSRDRFYTAFQRLMGKRRGWDRELVEFENAAQEICGICPKWQDFINHLEQARTKTGSHFQCA